ncbi:hypothetical protein N9L19_01350 [bacterium]|nr:hypothetical protein [bacterium]
MRRVPEAIVAAVGPRATWPSTHPELQGCDYAQKDPSSKNDPWWTESSLRLRDLATIYDGDYEVRRQHEFDRGHLTEEQNKYFQTEAVRLCTRCRDVGSENGKKLAHRAQDEKLLVHRINARHSTHKAAKMQPSSAFDGLRHVINLVRGCNMTRNIAYKYGLANGTRGKLVGVVYPTGRVSAASPRPLSWRC